MIDKRAFDAAVEANKELIEWLSTDYIVQAMKAILSPDAIKNQEWHIDCLWREFSRAKTKKAKRKIINKILDRMVLARFMRQVWFDYNKIRSVEK